MTPPLRPRSPRGRGLEGGGAASGPLGRAAGRLPHSCIALPRSCSRIPLPPSPSRKGRGDLLLPVLLLALSGCKLIDQTTFAPAPEAAPVVAATPAPVAPRIDPRTPLLVIDYATANPDYEGVLGYAVRAAEARDRNVQFDVVALAPSAEQMVGAQVQAAGVMRNLMANRVPSGRIHLGLLSDPALTANQVRVYVR